MSETLLSPKLRPWHLDHLAIVYVRQSSTQQIFEHKESRERQYALADYATLLGWPRERIVVIDEDQGRSQGHQHQVLDHVEGQQSFVAGGDRRGDRDPRQSEPEEKADGPPSRNRNRDSGRRVKL